MIAKRHLNELWSLLSLGQVWWLPLLQREIAHVLNEQHAPKPRHETAALEIVASMRAAGVLCFMMDGTMRVCADRCAFDAWMGVMWDACEAAALLGGAA